MNGRFIVALSLKIPVLPESVPDALVAKWHVTPGVFVRRDQPLVDIETDKVILEVVAPQDGVVQSISLPVGSRGPSGAILGQFVEQAGSEQKQINSQNPETKAEPQPAISVESEKPAHTTQQESLKIEPILSPSVRQEILKNQIDPLQIVQKTGRERVTPEDLALFQSQNVDTQLTGDRQQRREPMSTLRKKIAQRLVYAQQTAAILTTFNEVNMQAIMDIRQKQKEAFEKQYQVKLGMMSFFMKAVCLALEKYPMLNAYIDQDDVVYQNYCDLGIAVSSDRGLIVPVIRDAQTLSFADCEKQLAHFAQQARDGKIALEDLQGGTFTITNGGVFGSLLSTPILNPPQSAILGMHKIQERPVVENHQIVIRPMMYLALSYDHRLIDGAQAVGFLVTVKGILEEPERFFLDLI